LQNLISYILVLWKVLSGLDDMKCSNCGAEIVNNSKFCEYCGSQITTEMQKEKEQLNKVGCPKCASNNITFNREKQSETKGKNGTSIVHNTVGVCKDCGYTWYPAGSGPVKKGKTWLWVLGWIFIFPVPLTILMLRPTNKLDHKIRYAIIAIAWIVYVVWIYGSKSSDKDNLTADNTPVIETTKEDSNAEPEAVEMHLYEHVEVKDVMNGTRTEKIGEYVVIKADSKICTEEAIADIYYNYFEKNDFNWIALIYTDKNDNTGIYFNKEVVVVNNKFEEDKYGDYSLISDGDELLYIPSGDGKTLIKQEFDEEKNTEEKSETSEDKLDSSNVDPELKAFLDSYEAYMDEYCEFMETYDSSDTKMLLQYTEMMTKYADFTKKAEAYDSETMSAADSAYYLEVMTRINAKLAKVAYTE